MIRKMKHQTPSYSYYHCRLLMTLCFCCLWEFNEGLLSASDLLHKVKNTPLNYADDASTGPEINNDQWYQNAISTESGVSAESALHQLLGDFALRSKDEQALGFLFVSNDWNLTEIAPIVNQLLGERTNLLTVVGGGVIGDHQELENGGGMSFLGGPLSGHDRPSIFTLNNADAMIPKCSPSSSVFLFSDPYCNRIQNLFEILDSRDCIVAGGISVPTKESQSTLAINDQILNPGSLIGVELPTTLGLQCVVSQGGCRPVGPTYRVTSVDGPAVYELDNIKAIDQLQAITEHVCEQDQDIIRNIGVLGGIRKEEDPSEIEDQRDSNRQDPPSELMQDETFMFREVTGFRPRSGSILVCGKPQIQNGDRFRFHVRDSEEALNDWKLILERTKTERLFLDKPLTSEKILCGLQFSSLARGSDFFQRKNVDLHHAQQLLQRQSNNQNRAVPPIGGFFANAEIGPIGIRMGAQADRTKPYLHGFASVVAILCDYSVKKKEITETSSASVDTGAKSSWE
jgi:small ligand-binding sensory domain FIST